MALVWNPAEEKPVGMVADRNLYLDKSGDKLAREDSVESASLLVGRGKEIDPADVARLRLQVVDGRVEQKGEAQADGDAGLEVEELVSEPESHGESEG